MKWFKKIILYSKYETKITRRWQQVSEWVIESFTQLIHLEMKQVALYEWITESLTHLIRSNC